MSTSAVETISAPEDRAPSLWLRVSVFKVGPLPLPVYVALTALTAAAVLTKRLPNDLIGGLTILMLVGFLMVELGSRLPVLKQIGGTAIMSLFVPSALIGYHLVDPEILKAVTATYKTANLQYLYIACLVAGSILGMDHKVLVQGFLRMFVPLLIGTAVAIGTGVLVGLLFGYEIKHTFFFIVVPILGGGLGEGVLPLSLGYAEMLHRPQADLVAMMVPAALLGNVVAIIASGMLNRLGEKRPAYSGNGILVRSGADRDLLAGADGEAPVDFGLMGAGLLLACGFYILGVLLAPVTGIPGPILMIVGAAILKVTKLIPARMELGAYQMYRFMTTNLTSSILVAMGALLVSWPQLTAAFTLGYFAICTATVLAMIAAGFFVGRWLNMYPVESAIVTACHSGLGGTGDVAILSAANRMGLMPFAQISTRIGGAAMIVIATLLMKAFY
ncbi:2-hydroxycarboxylate transporter family protein [Beijerinckia sp. L45]|uniref:2-hydroxycarboxylate transporter family protein n=1 Tax=Beijerinckia sp. L45 TaxID=1641855 RepID=UPI00131BCA20|nr:2-hydroxycarboxylate transporter family protein [Beijerinckia sp. L45]